MMYCDLYRKIFSLEKKNRCYRNYNEINYVQLIEIMKNNKVYLIDVRSKMEYDEGHLNGAINIPLSNLEKNIGMRISTNDIIVVYCQYGIRSKKAVSILNNIGYKNVYSLKGGLENIY